MIEEHGRKCFSLSDVMTPVISLTAARNFRFLFLDPTLYGQVHPSSYIHPQVMPGHGVTAEPYQPRRDGLTAMEDSTKESTYLYVDSTHHQETTVAPIPTTRWPDSVVVQGAIVRKKFHCPRCNSGYTRLSDMKTHCQFQCGKEPRYQCPYCTKKAKFSSNMYVHVRRMHKDKKLQIIDLYKQLSRAAVRC